MSDDGEPRWLIWSNKHGRWWNPDRAGYTGVIEQAGRYPKHIVDHILSTSNFGGIVNSVRVLAPEFNDG